MEIRPNVPPGPGDPTPAPGMERGALSKQVAEHRPIGELAARLRQGDREAMGPWYEAEFALVHRLCLGFLGSRSEADDLAQDAMLHLSSKLEHWDPSRPYKPWRNSLVANLCRDRLRSNERRARHEQAAAEGRNTVSQISASGNTEERELRELLDGALAKLTAREREVFVLVDLEGYGAIEAGEQLGLPASTVRSYLSLGRRKLRDLLAPLNPEGGQ